MQAATVLGAGWSSSTPLLSGDAGTEQTIALMRNAAAEAWRDPLVRALAGSIIRDLPPENQKAHTRAIFEWVRHSIRFVRDPVEHETVQSPRWTVTHGFGDCDDHSLLLVALLGAVGIPTQLVTLALDPAGPETFTHIYAEALVEGRAIALDTARPGARFDSAPARWFRKRVWQVSDASFQDLQGLSGVPAGLGLGSLIEDILKIIPAGTQAATTIIGATRVPRERLSLPGVTRPPTYYETPAGARYYERGQAPSVFAGVEPTTLLLLIGGVVVVLMLMPKRG